MGAIELYNTVMEKPLAVYEIFKEFFGEERVDMQGLPTFEDVESALSAVGMTVHGAKNIIIRHINEVGNPFILVHFPHVTVKNEHDHSTEVDDLFAKVEITLDGRLFNRFKLNRATYSLLHIENDYMHSHIPGIPVSDFTSFLDPCTGSGPINTTMHSLNDEYSEDLWRLFCLEMSKFVEVESLNGGPYRRLDSLTPGGRNVSSFKILPELSVIKTYGSSSFQTPLTIDMILDFIRYVISSKKLKFAYEGCYTLAMNAQDFLLVMSNLFIDWFNEMRDGKNEEETQTIIRDLTNNRILIKAYMEDGYLIEKRESVRSNPRRFIGQPVCVFKGRNITINIPDLVPNEDQEEDHHLNILDTKLCQFILIKILYILNYRYGNIRSEEETKSGKKTIFL